MILKRIGPWSLARVLAVIYACVGFTAEVAFSLSALLGAVASRLNGGPIPGMLEKRPWDLSSLIFLPLLYAVLGALLGAFGAVIYNLLARWMGGVEIELVEKPARPDGASDLTSAG